MFSFQGLWLLSFICIIMYWYKAAQRLLFRPAEKNRLFLQTLWQTFAVLRYWVFAPTEKNLHLQINFPRSRHVQLEHPKP